MLGWLAKGPLPLNLALQGGGAHGALSWGVLDALLASGQVAPAALSGASAGAMNAVALAQGWLEGGAAGARAALERFWLAVANSMPPAASMLHTEGATPAPVVKLWMAWTRHLTPEQSNPLGINPLRDIVRSQIDFAALRAFPGPQLHIGVTDAQTGQLRVIQRQDITEEALLASACLPALFPPTVLEGRPCWDGGFSANPPVLPLVEASPAPDTLMVLLSPLRFEPLPQTAAQIQQRMLEMGLTASFQREMQLLDIWCAQARRVWLPLTTRTRRLARCRFHRIEGGQCLAGMGTDSRWVVHRDFLWRLRDAGQQLAVDWLRSGWRAS